MHVSMLKAQANIASSTSVQIPYFLALAQLLQLLLQTLWLLLLARRQQLLC
jgi:hypothetical protein